MPEYFPQIQFPTGMAEEVAKLLAQKGQNLAQGIQSAGQSIAQGFERRAAAKAGQVDPSKVQSMMDALRGQGQTTPVQIGQNQPGPMGIPSGRSIDIPKPMPKLNPAEASLAERMAAAKEATARTMGRQELAGEQSALKGHVQLTPDMLSANPELAAKGYVAGNYIPEGFLKPSAKPMDSDLTSEEQNALTRATLREKNPLDPSIINFKGPRSKTIAQALLKDPNYSPLKAKGETAATISGAAAGERFQRAGPPQVLARYANSTKEVLKVVEEASKNYPRFGEQFLNMPYNKLKTQDSPEALQFKQSIADLRGHIAAVLAKGYAPQKEQIDEAAHYIPDTITPKQLTEDLPFLNRLIDIQVRGMMTPVEPGSAQKSGEQGNSEDIKALLKEFKGK